MHRFAEIAALVLLTTATSNAAPLRALPPAQKSVVDLAFTKTRLDNGLTVIVHPDATLPLVAVDILYKVGARDEAEGRTGFAHLFEHLMFMGTARAPTKMFDAWMEEAGGTNNAWTGPDFTDYHEVGGSTLLPLFLWLEADRLETLGRTIDRPKLDLQRDVVRNERRQSIENVPYGKVELRLPELLYPSSHPYHHPVIGSHQDLEAASVEDVRAFFARWYVPSNASVVVAGDVRPEDAERLVRQYLGKVPSADPPKATPRPPEPRLGRVVRETIEDDVELAKIVVAYHSPAHFAPGDAELDLFAAVLARGKASRLYRKLVYEKPIAQAVHAEQQSGNFSSVFAVEMLVRPDGSLEEAEKALDAALAEATARPPSDEELLRAKSETERTFVEALEPLAARATRLNLYEAELGDPGSVGRDLARYRTATAAGVLDWAKRTLKSNERVVLRVVPRKKRG